MGELRSSVGQTKGAFIGWVWGACWWWRGGRNAGQGGLELLGSPV